MKKILLFLLSIFVGIALFLWIYSMVGWEEIKNSLSVFKGFQGLIILSLTFLVLVIGTFKWKEVLKEKRIKVSFKTLFLPYLAGFSLMFLAPVMFLGGEIFRAYVLKEKKFLTWSVATASVIIDRILEWTSSLVVILLGILFFLFKNGPPSQKLGTIFGTALLIFTGGIFVFYFKTLKKESIAKSLARFFNHKLDKEPLEIEKEIFDFFNIKNKSMWKGFGLSFLKLSIMYVRNLLLINFLGKGISALYALSILSFNLLAAMIPIPASLGSHEAIQVFAFDSLGLGSAPATAFTMIIRAAELVIALFGMIILFQLGFVILKNNFFKKIEELTRNNEKQI